MKRSYTMGYRKRSYIVIRIILFVIVFGGLYLFRMYEQSQKPVTKINCTYTEGIFVGSTYEFKGEKLTDYLMNYKVNYDDFEISNEEMIEKGDKNFLFEENSLNKASNIATVNFNEDHVNIILNVNLKSFSEIDESYLFTVEDLKEYEGEYDLAATLNNLNSDGDHCAFE